MTNKEIYEFFKRMEEKFDNYCDHQKKINDLVIRHDEKIKGIWKIPVVSGSIVTIFSVIMALMMFMS